MTTPFTPFSRQMPTFFRALEKNNDREWFSTRKPLFETHIRTPMLGLVTLLNQKLSTFAPDHITDNPARNIYRIYRDTRFSKDKTPYKTHIGATFAHRSLPRHGGAGYYFELSHRYVGIAGGVYMPGPDELRAIRTAIAADPKRFLAILDRPKKLFGQLQGERLTRLPKPWQSHTESPAADYLKFKQFYWWAELPASLALAPKLKLPNTLIRYFQAMSDSISWFNQILLADLQQREPQSPPQRPTAMW
jgi:uncharacterized protein (TIGR02453 family)